MLKSRRRELETEAPPGNNRWPTDRTDRTKICPALKAKAILVIHDIMEL
jgi:hypothetical protein